MEKVYQLGVEDSYYFLFVRAESPGKAKMLAIGQDGFEDAEFTDISVKRAKWADNLKNFDDYDFIEACLKNGIDYTLDPDYESETTLYDTDLPMIKGYGGWDKFFDAVIEKHSLKDGSYYGTTFHFEDAREAWQKGKLLNGFNQTTA